MKKKLIAIQREIHKPAILVRDFHTLPLIRGKTSSHKYSKDVEDLNNAINQLYLADIYRTFQLTTSEYIFFSSTHNIYQGILYSEP